MALQQKNCSIANILRAKTLVYNNSGVNRLRFAKNMSDRAELQLPNCPECQKPVELETAWVDEAGKAVHADCYLGNLRRERASAPPWEP